jgi:NAD+ kinase
LEKELENLLHQQYKIITRFSLQTSYKNRSVIALNDIVLEKNMSKMITVKAFANEQYIGDYRADGLIITTPTGSTAYSLSCGGPILFPDSNVLCITPISPHSLTLRPLVISNDKELKFQIFSPSGASNLVTDGSIVASIYSGDTVKISLSTRKINLIVPFESNFYDVLRKKLLWAEYSLEK